MYILKLHNDAFHRWRRRNFMELDEYKFISNMQKYQEKNMKSPFSLIFWFLCAW